MLMGKRVNEQFYTEKQGAGQVICRADGPPRGA